MRHLHAAAFALLLAFALAAAGCGESPCQDLGERLCRCEPGTTADSCKRQVEAQLKDIDPSSALEDYCQARLDSCSAPAEAEFCEWLVTTAGKDACGLTPAVPAP